MLFLDSSAIKCHFLLDTQSCGVLAVLCCESLSYKNVGVKNVPVGLLIFRLKTQAL